MISIALILDVYAFFKTITLKKITNGFLLRLSYFITKYSGLHIHWGKIESLSIEPTNLCNLYCPECPSGNDTMTRERLFISQNSFNNIIDQTYKYLSYLQLFFQGEPFLHLKIYDYIRVAVQKKIYTTTSTNGHFLTPANCNKIVKSGLHRIIISVDGATQEVYEKYRIGGNLKSVTDGITNLIKSKKKLKSITPFIIMQFVVFSTNEHQIYDMKRLAKSLKVNNFQIKTAQINDFKNGNKLIPRNRKYSRYYQTTDNSFKLNRKPVFKCWRIWNGAVITAENKLLPCCFDKNAEHQYNQPNNKNLQSFWKDEKAQSFRKKVWSKNNTISICQNCTEGLK